MLAARIKPFCTSNLLLVKYSTTLEQNTPTTIQQAPQVMVQQCECMHDYIKKCAVQSYADYWFPTPPSKRCGEGLTQMLKKFSWPGGASVSLLVGFSDGTNVLVHGGDGLVVLVGCLGRWWRYKQECDVVGINNFA